MLNAINPENMQEYAKVPGMYMEGVVGGVGKGVGAAKEAAFGRGNLIDFDGSNKKDKRRRIKERAEKARRAADLAMENAKGATALAASDQAFRDKWGGFTKDEVKSAGKMAGGVTLAFVAYSMLRSRPSTEHKPGES